MWSMTVPTGQVMGIGKLKIVVPLEDRNIPMPTFAFIVSKAEDENFNATCLNLQIDANANELKKAIDRLVDNCHSFVSTLFKMCPDTVWEQLESLAEWDNREWWGAYRKFEMRLTQHGVSTDRDIEGQLIRKIQQLQEELDIYKQRPVNDITLKVVSYHPIEEVA